MLLHQPSGSGGSLRNDGSSCMKSHYFRFDRLIMRPAKAIHSTPPCKKSNICLLHSVPPCKKNMFVLKHFLIFGNNFFFFGILILRGPWKIILVEALTVFFLVRASTTTSRGPVTGPRTSNVLTDLKN